MRVNSGTLMNYHLFICLSVLAYLVLVGGTKQKKKDPSTYTDADLERIYEQWEEGDDPLEEDELPEHKRKPKPVDYTKLDMNNPEALLAASKQGKPIMMFVTVSGTPSKRQVDDITSLWQTSLYNNHMDVQRFEIEERRVIFMFKEGQQAFEAVKWLIEQDRCEEVVLEGKTYNGKASKKGKTEL